jgi:predicted RecA/RadA family phage recombinase
MPAIFIQEGESIDYTPTEDVALGAVVVLANAIGVACRPIPASTLGALAMGGVFEVPRAPGAALPQGTTLHWDATAQVAVIDPAGGANRYLGISVNTIEAEATTVRVRLNH